MPVATSKVKFSPVLSSYQKKYYRQNVPCHGITHMAAIPPSMSHHNRALANLTHTGHTHNSV
ncbi:hypothetical protein SCLCIDRAFT_1223698 [Scleroderma citrinum Foug A]|uniref:Uncharacterized protein n=1 Tax=Scleroderma citrinum Foug A TaxID=1036808 RepID=A0A0C3CVA4_9AGAM|nr:hypothetical protein SCLCIDRAFT_1223698 [Scleroderma citrinum Foug A]